ncbi:MAG: TonB-dependent siderophore receptor [Cyanobacteria bacterium P01_F01_bin.86]
MKSLLELIFLRARNSWSGLFVSLLLTPLLILLPATGIAQSDVQPDAQGDAQGDVISQSSDPSLLEQLRPVEVLGVELVELEDGLKVVLVTNKPEQVEVFQFQEGATLTVDITNAILSLADEDSYQQLNPIPGVASLTLEQRGSEIQMTVVSDEETPPVAYFERLTESLELDVVKGPPSETDADIDFGSNNLRIIVSAAPLGYRVPNASIGTRTDTAIINVPQSIQVIPEQVLEDQNAQTLNEALRNASGVSTGRALSGTRSATPLIRGFENNNNILRNGLRDDTLQFGSGLPNVERVEILKGPASVLFGAGDVGGTINLVTERPLYEPSYEFEIEGGSFGAYGANLDFGGPLDDQGRLAYRLNLEYSGEESFINFQDGDFFFVAPSLQLVNTERSSLILDLEYLRSRGRQSSAGLPAYAAIGLDNNTFIDTFRASIPEEQADLAGTLDISTNVAEPTLGRSEVNVTRFGYRLSHEFNDDWKLNHEFLASFQETPVETFVVGIAPFQSLGQTDITKVRRLFLSNPSERESYIFNTNFVGEFDVFGIDQTLLVGAEVSLEEEKDTIVLRQEINPNGFDLFDPVYSTEGFEYFDLETAFPNNNQISNRNRYSLYGQTQLDLFSGDLIALLGGRVDFIDQDFRDTANRFNTEPIELNDAAFSPRVGLVYKPSENISIYTSYSQSFNPVIGQSAELEVFEPERGRQFEVGIKTSFLNDKFSSTLAYYDLTRTNVLTQDVENTGFQVQIGEQKSTGTEFDFAGEILPGWNIIANYANTNARVSQDNEIEVGTRLINAPRNSASLWTTYQLQEGALEGLGFGLGVYFVGIRNGELRRPFEVPAYTRTDASLFYEKNSFRTQVNFENLFNTRYIEGARDQFRVQPGAPFGVSASVNWEF